MLLFVNAYLLYINTLYIMTVYFINDWGSLWRGLIVQIAKLKQSLRHAKSKVRMWLIYIARVLIPVSAARRFVLPNRLITS